jgi:hypothetical protein
MSEDLATLPLSYVGTGPAILQDSIPTYDPGMNFVSSESALNNVAEFASKIGSTVSGVLNNIRYGTGPGGITPVAAQPQAVAGTLSIGTILLLAVGAFALVKFSGKK